MPFEFDKEKESVTVIVGKGDVCTGAHEDGLRLYDLGQECEVGQSLGPCLGKREELGVEDRVVTIRGTYEGMRAVALQLLTTISLCAPADRPPLPPKLNKCATCGCEGNEFSPLVDTGVFMICGACLRSMVRIIEEEK